MPPGELGAGRPCSRSRRLERRRLYRSDLAPDSCRESRQPRSSSRQPEVGQGSRTLALGSNFELSLWLNGADGSRVGAIDHWRELDLSGSLRSCGWILEIRLVARSDLVAFQPHFR